MSQPPLPNLPASIKTTEKGGSRFIDGLITYRILTLLLRPFTETKAYKLGIIDEKGNLLKKEKDLTSSEQKNSYTLLHRLIFRLKRIIEKIPFANKQLLTFAIALGMIRESYAENHEPVNLESLFLERINDVPHEEDVYLVEKFMNERTISTFRQFMEEDIAMNSVSVPAGSSPAIAGMGVGGPDDVAVPPGNKLTTQRRKKVLPNDKEDYPYTNFTVQKTPSPRS